MDGVTVFIPFDALVASAYQKDVTKAIRSIMFKPQFRYNVSHLIHTTFSILSGAPIRIHRKEKKLLLKLQFKNMVRV
jgi:hypothetical protein